METSSVSAEKEFPCELRMDEKLPQQNEQPVSYTHLKRQKRNVAGLKLQDAREFIRLSHKNGITTITLN